MHLTNYFNRLGERILLLRKAVNMKQSAFSGMIDCNLRTFQRAESGSFCSYETINKILDQYTMDADVLLGFSPEAFEQYIKDISTVN